MSTEAQTIKAARDSASATIGKAQAELTAAAKKIAAEHGLPDGINGLTSAEFLGRLSFVTSLSRDLRSAGEDYLANKAIKDRFEDPIVPINQVDRGQPKGKDNEPAGVNMAADVSKLTIQPMTVKALKAAGIHTVADVELYTDEAMLKVRGIAPPSLGKLREAVMTFKNPASRHA